VSLQYGHRLLVCGLPDGDARILAAGRNAPVPEKGDRVHSTLVKPQDLLGSAGGEGPSNGRGIEAGRDQLLSVGRYRERTHRPAMTAQLRVRRNKRPGQQQNEDERPPTNH